MNGIRKKITLTFSALSVVCVNAMLASAVKAVPVVPNFQQGSMTSRTETQSTVTETINSIDMRTGWEYSVTGVGISNDGEALNPNVNNSTVTVTPSSSSGTAGGNVITGTVTSSFDSLDFSSPSSFTITDPGGAFQFTQSYQGPGVTNQTIIQRTSVIQSVTDTTSTFTQ